MIYNREKGYNLIMIPKAIQSEIVRCAHEKDHFTARRIKENFKQKYHIPDLCTKIEKCIANYVKCILINKKAGKKEGFLYPIKENLSIFIT